MVNLSTILQLPEMYEWFAGDLEAMKRAAFSTALEELGKAYLAYAIVMYIFDKKRPTSLEIKGAVVEKTKDGYFWLKDGCIIGAMSLKDYDKSIAQMQKAERRV